MIKPIQLKLFIIGLSYDTVVGMGLIYLATNKVNWKVYIGQTWRSLKERKYEHIKASRNGNSNMLFHKAISKHGIDNFDWTVLFESDDKELLNEKEIFYIDQYKKENPRNIYNMTSGGQNNINIWAWAGHREFIQERQKIAWTDDRKKDFSINNPSIRKLMCLETGEIFNSGRAASKRYNVSAGNLSMCASGKYNGRQTCAGMHWIFYKNDLTEKERNDLINKIGTPTMFGSGNPNARKVMRLDTGEIFLTMKSAAIAVNGNACQLKVAINHGWRYRKTYWKTIKD